MASTRPLRVVPGSTSRQTTRAFACFDHSPPGAPALVSITGGKTTTARRMAEALSDLVCLRLGWRAECRTRTEPLLSYRAGIAG